MDTQQIEQAAGVALSPASLDWVRTIVAEQVAAERERIRQMALDFANSRDNGQPYGRTELIREFAALLEKS